MFDKAYVASLPKTDTELSINGAWLNEAVPGYRTHSVEGRRDSYIDLASKEMSKKDGSFFRYKRLKDRIIKIEFGLLSDTRIEGEKSIDKLLSILQVDNLKVIFYDEPDVYWECHLSNFTIHEEDASSSGVYFKTGNIELTSTKSYKFSNIEVMHTNNGTSDTITLNNTGSASTPLTIKAKIKKDCDYIGFVLDKADGESLYYQIGNPESSASGKANTNDSETLFDDNAQQILANWSQNTGWSPDDRWRWNWNFPAQKQGSFILGDNNGQKYVYCSDFGSEPVQDGSSEFTDGKFKWYGPSITKTLVPNKAGKFPVDWKFAYRVDFSENDANAIGHQSINLCGAGGQSIFSFAIEKNIAGTHGKIGVVRTNDWTTRDEFQMPGLGSLSGSWGNMITIEKKGYTITISTLVSHYGSEVIPFSRTYTLNKKDTELRSVTFSTFRFHKQYPSVFWSTIYQAKLVMYNKLSQNGSVNNVLNAGDTLTINSENGSCDINGTQNWDNVDIGSDLLLLDKGVHKLRIITSSWAPIPEVSVTYRERWK